MLHAWPFPGPHLFLHTRPRDPLLWRGLPPQCIETTARILPTNHMWQNTEPMSTKLYSNPRRKCHSLENKTRGGEDHVLGFGDEFRQKRLWVNLSGHCLQGLYTRCGHAGDWVLTQRRAMRSKPLSFVKCGSIELTHFSGHLFVIPTVVWWWPLAVIL